MKKVLVLVLCLAMVTMSLAACGEKEVGTDGETTTPASSAGTVDPAKLVAVAAADLKIGFVHISDPSDMGYTYNHDLGTQAMKEQFKLTDTQIINKFNVPEDATCETAINELIDAGCSIIFATSFGHEEFMVAAAKENPSIQFCHASGAKAAGSGLSNMHNYFALIYQARYLTGIAAGLKTETNMLGYVAAFPFPEVISGYDAFYLGAKSVNPDVEMMVMYTSNWNDPTKEAQVAQALIDKGCDVISQHSDSTAPATTAEQNNVWQVGYNADMIKAAPKSSLVSARIDWSKYLIYAIQCMVDGKAIDVDWSKGLADEVVYLSPLNKGIVAEGTEEAIETAKAKMISGDWDVFTGPLLNVDGEVVLEEGKTFIEPASSPSWNHILQGIIVFE